MSIHATATKDRQRTYRLGETTLTAGPCPSGLHVVATPIGHLGDITLRALDILAGADLIACEDTRVTRKLLDRYAIATPLTPYHDHNAEAARPKILARIAGGAAVALVSDAGTPLVSDPGFKLVRAARAAGVPVTAAPGASAVLAALAIAGLPTDRFFFEGFLPAKPGARASRIETLRNVPATLVIYESGPRIAATLADLATIFGARDAAVCREMTKLHEEVKRADLSALAGDYAAGAETRGEFVIVVAPPADEGAPADIDDLLRHALGGASLKDAVAAVVAATGAARRDVYRRALELAKDGAEPER